MPVAELRTPRHRLRRSLRPLLLLAALAGAGSVAAAEPKPDGAPEGKEDAPPTTTERPRHQESARRHATQPYRGGELEEPPLPRGLSLDEVLERANQPSPAGFPAPVPDDRVHVFTFFEQLEYRSGGGDSKDLLGWEAQGWVGGPVVRFWWKNEGEASFAGPDAGETETDLLYSRLVTPFWSVQGGVQHALEWEDGEEEHRWSAVFAVQGLAPYKVELDNSLYLSEDGDVTLEVEAEYDVRITQRLVFQPRAELGFAAQDVPERGLGSGLTDGSVDVRLRYEFWREFAPYVGLRYAFLAGETADLAEREGEDTEELSVLVGLRFAF